jgi:hypothetical protein
MNDMIGFIVNIFVKIIIIKLVTIGTIIYQSKGFPPLPSAILLKYKKNAGIKLKGGTKKIGISRYGLSRDPSKENTRIKNWANGISDNNALFNSGDHFII